MAKMTREEAQETVEALYGLDRDFIMQVIEELGYAALSDEGLRLLAQFEDAHEQAEAEHWSQPGSWF
jgi:hypothetical protein